MRLTLAVALVFVLVSLSFAQAGRRVPTSDGKKNERPKPAETKPEASKTNEAEPPQSDDTAEEVDDGGAVKVDTTLVPLPVIVSDRGGRYVPDLEAEEFNVSEDGAEQKVSFFATVSEPFHVVLLIDTSASTTAEKMRQVQEAAVTFVNNLQTDDRVKVVSFDDDVRVLCDFTGDRAALASAIRATRPGKGTRLYDAFDLAYRSLRRVKGRKAVVMLTDGVDWHSDSRTYDDNRRAVVESGGVVYAVRFDTRTETEQLAREQSQGGQRGELGAIFGGKDSGLPGGGGTVQVKPRGRRPTTDPRDGGDSSRDASRGGGPGGTDTFPTTSGRPEDPGEESLPSLSERIHTPPGE